MNTTLLIRAIVKKLSRYRLIILAAGMVCGLLLFYYAKQKGPVYTAKATMFPLTNAGENGLSTNTLSGLLGLGDAPKSFSNEAAINIIELTLSRFVRESVASTPLPQFNNQTIAALLIKDFNIHRPLFTKKVAIPTDSLSLAIAGGELLKAGISAKMSKNGVLELYYSNQARELVSPVSFVLIDKISQFYIDLKIRKAREDYNFTLRKIDSLEAIISHVDRRAIRMQNTTLFAPEKLEFDIPRDRINADKQRYMRQRDISLNNQEEALWRLQKLTPIISVLDKPTEPFTVSGSPSIVYAVGGFILGCLLAALLLVSGLLYRYTKSELKESIFGVPGAAL